LFDVEISKLGGAEALIKVAGGVAPTLGELPEGVMGAGTSKLLPEITIVFPVATGPLPSS
jgi:hypothetical protein